MTHFRSCVLLETITLYLLLREINHVTSVPDVVFSRGCGQGCQSFCFFFLCRVFIPWQFIVFLIDGTSQNVVMVLASTVIVVSYLVIGNLYLHCLFHLIQLVSVPCCRQCHVFLSLASSPFSCKKTRQAQAQGTDVELLHNPQDALSVFHSMDAPIPRGQCLGTCLRAAVPFHHFLQVALGPIQSRSSSGEKYGCCSSVSSGDSVHCSLAKARLTLVCSFLYRVHQLAIGSYFFLFRL